MLVIKWIRYDTKKKISTNTQSHIYDAWHDVCPKTVLSTARHWNKQWLIDHVLKVFPLFLTFAAPVHYTSRRFFGYLQSIFLPDSILFLRFSLGFFSSFIQLLNYFSFHSFCKETKWKQQNWAENATKHTHIHTLVVAANYAFCFKHFLHKHSKPNESVINSINETNTRENEI